MAVTPLSYIYCTYPSGGGSAPSICFYTQEKVFVSSISHSGDNPRYRWYQVPAGCYYVRDSVKKKDASMYSLRIRNSTVQAPAPLFAVGNAADEYEAVQGVTTHRMASVDLGTLNWTVYTYGSITNIFSAAAPDDCLKNSNGSVANIINDKYEVFAFDTTPHFTTKDKCVCQVSPPKRCIIRDTSYSDAATFKTAMSGVYLYYELATPTTSQSTPTQLSLQAGDNVAMQTDGGRPLEELSMTYENLPANE
jgi:hypothetical protein